MTLLHNVCCCCMTRLVTLTITTPQSSTKKVCERQKEREREGERGRMVLRGWSAVLPVGEQGDGY